MEPLTFLQVQHRNAVNNSKRGFTEEQRFVWKGLQIVASRCTFPEIVLVLYIYGKNRRVAAPNRNSSQFV